MVGFEVRAESGSRFAPKRLGGDDCHPLARCSATVNPPIFLRVATIGSQRLPSAASKLGIVIKIIRFRSQLRQIVVALPFWHPISQSLLRTPV